VKTAWEDLKGVARLRWKLWRGRPEPREAKATVPVSKRA